MARPTWIRADDGDWYRASEASAVKTVPHAQGGHSVVVETRRHDNIDVTGRLADEAVACRCRDALAVLLTRVDDGSVITYTDGGFRTEPVGDA